ncbi:thiamine ABC transporter substrate binding subunit [Pseudactinotalea sp. HY158]|uniref:thiamine ABC transporter substrate-binding protein n=1 Tax=Pseudactinotalea sp. HY158 TaxID=2654547 RepID=UPI001E526FF0|nr:thiamine ABC transporter substrate-binding protein [Pseudactinotalea sp. HY158]
MALPALAALTGAALAGCSLAGGGAPEPAGSVSQPTTVRVVTHDSFNLDEALLDSFEAETGYTLEFSAPGDGGTLVNQLILTKDSPLGDVAFGIDNSFAGRALAEDVFADYTPADLPASAAAYAVDGDSAALTPIDVGDVCMNVDHQWFADHDLDEPVTLDDLTLPAYADLTVVSNPARSSPGLAFLLATIGEYGDQWVAYWQRLDENGLKIVDSWSDVYYTDFTAAEGAGGTRPIALSYSTSPAFTITDDGDSTTGALLETCFRQVEYAGVLAGAENPAGAQAFLDFLLSAPVQADIPGQMFMYPVDDTVRLPADWVAHAPLAPNPITVPQADIDAHLDEWLRTWQEQVVG